MRFFASHIGILLASQQISFKFVYISPKEKFENIKNGNWVMSLWQPQILITYPWMYNRYRSRLFVQAGHENQFSLLYVCIRSLSEKWSTTSSKMAQFWFSNSFFTIKNWCNLSDVFSFEDFYQWFFLKRTLIVIAIYFSKVVPIFCWLVQKKNLDLYLMHLPTFATWPYDSYLTREALWSDVWWFSWRFQVFGRSIG